METKDSLQSDANLCHINQWVVGDRLIGDEGHGPTVIQITAIGEQSVLFKMVSHNSVPAGNHRDSVWTLTCRSWKKAN